MTAFATRPVPGPGRQVAGRPGGPDRGSATAEFAVALPALILVLLFAITGIDAMLARLQCQDAARDAVLAAARGQDGASEGRTRAPRGAVVTVDRTGAQVHAVVSVTLTPLGPHLPGLTVRAEAQADVEPGVGTPGEQSDGPK